MHQDRLREIVSRFGDKRILVVGDFYLDGYWEVDQTKSDLSLETPWHVNPVVQQRYYPGAAGTVVNNLCALGAGEVNCVGVIGTDGFADTLVGKLRENGASPDSLVKSDLSITPVYLKVMHHGYGEIVMEGPRFDFENQEPMAKENQDAVMRHVKELLPRSDAVIIIDQVPTEDFGVITEQVRKELLDLAEKRKEKVFYADSRTRIGRYGHLIIKPNRFEAVKALHPDWVGRDVSTDEACSAAAELSRRTGRQVYLTLGGDGILVAAGGSVEQVAGVKVRQKTDIVGAGDSVTAGIVLALTADATDLEAGEIGNLVASITITKIGVTGTATQEEVLRRHRESSR